MSGFSGSNLGRDHFKKGVDAEASRRSRVQTSYNIRKEKKDDRLNQRRRVFGGMENSVMGTPDGNPQMELQLQRLPAMVAGIKSANPPERYEATIAFRKILSIERCPPIDEVIRAGVVPYLVEFIKPGNTCELQFEAAWALTNIASGTTEHTKAVIDAGAVPIFTQLLQSPNVDVREQAIWALGNISGDSSKYRDIVLSCGALPYVLNEMANSKKISLLRNATWTLSNFCRGKPAPDFSIVSKALPTLAYLVKEEKDNEILVDACWAVSYLSDGKEPRIQEVISTGVLPRLVELLSHSEISIQTPALRTIGNIVTGDDHQTQAVINAGALPCLLQLLSSSKRSIVKEACWTISNITAGIPAQIQSVIQANIIPPLIDLLKNGEFEIRKEAAWAISNATSGGTPEQIKYIVQQGCIRPLCDLLSEQDLKIVKVALEGLENILKAGEQDSTRTGMENEYARFVEEAGGVNKIEDLQMHQNKEVFERAASMIETFFGGEEVEGPGDMLQQQSNMNAPGNMFQQPALGQAQTLEQQQMQLQQMVGHYLQLLPAHEQQLVIQQSQAIPPEQQMAFWTEFLQQAQQRQQPQQAYNTGFSFSNLQ